MTNIFYNFDEHLLPTDLVEELRNNYERYVTRFANYYIPLTERDLKPAMKFEESRVYKDYCGDTVEVVHDDGTFSWVKSQESVTGFIIRTNDLKSLEPEVGDTVTVSKDSPMFYLVIGKAYDSESRVWKLWLKNGKNGYIWGTVAISKVSLLKKGSK